MTSIDYLNFEVRVTLKPMDVTVIIPISFDADMVSEHALDILSDTLQMEYKDVLAKIDTVEVFLK